MMRDGAKAAPLLAIICTKKLLELCYITLLITDPLPFVFIYLLS